MVEALLPFLKKWELPLFLQVFIERISSSFFVFNLMFLELLTEVGLYLILLSLGHLSDRGAGRLKFTFWDKSKAGIWCNWDEQDERLILLSSFIMVETVFWRFNSFRTSSFFLPFISLLPDAAVLTDGCPLSVILRKITSLRSFDFCYWLMVLTELSVLVLDTASSVLLEGRSKH